MVIDQNEHILSQKHLRRNNIWVGDVGWNKDSSYYNTSIACVETITKQLKI